MQHIWIFQLEQALSQSAQDSIMQGMTAFLAKWNAHGTPVPGKATLKYDQFLIVEATPGATSGCSIDSMTHAAKDVLRDAGATVAPDNFIFFRDAAGKLDKVDFREIGAAITAGRLTADTVIFDASMGQENDFSKWEVRLADSWLKRYLVKV